MRSFGPLYRSENGQHIYKSVKTFPVAIFHYTPASVSDCQYLCLINVSANSVTFCLELRAFRITCIGYVGVYMHTVCRWLCQQAAHTLPCRNHIGLYGFANELMCYMQKMHRYWTDIKCWTSLDHRCCLSVHHCTYFLSNGLFTIVPPLFVHETLCIFDLRRMIDWF